MLDAFPGPVTVVFKGQQHKPRGATPGGYGADVQFRQADLRTLLGGDAEMAGQRQLQTAAKAVAAEYGDYRFLQLLDLPLSPCYPYYPAGA